MDYVKYLMYSYKFENKPGNLRNIKNVKKITLSPVIHNEINVCVSLIKDLKVEIIILKFV